MASSSGVICLSRYKTTKKRRYSLIPLISGKEISVGRGLDVSVQLLSRRRDSMVLLSRKHAIFKEMDDGKWTITDNKSLNGVYLNDVRLKAGLPFPIEEGDMIQIGAVPDGGTEAEFVFQVKEEQLSAELANQMLDSLNPANLGKRRNSQQGLPATQVKDNAKVSSKQDQTNTIVSKRKRSDELSSNKAMKSGNNLPTTGEPSSSSIVTERTVTKYSPSKKKATLSKEEGEILNAILSQKGKHSVKDIVRMIQNKSLSPSKRREDDDLRLQLEEKEKLLNAKTEEMRAATESLKAKALAKENCLMEQLEKQREQLLHEKLKMEKDMKEMAETLEAKAHEKELTLIEQLTQQREELLSERQIVEKALQENLAKQLAEKDENFNKEQGRLRKELEDRIKQKDDEMLAEIEAQKKALLVEKQLVEESMQSEVAKNVEQREKLETERKLLEEVIANKDEEYKTMQTKLEEGQKARQEEEEMKIAKAKQEAFDNITNVLESELQCSICAELFIQATTLNCSHSFCKYCIMLWMKRKKECPVCRARINSHNRSIVLDNYIDKMVENLGEDVKMRRKEMLDDRKKSEDLTAPVIISDGDEEEEEDEDIDFIDSNDEDRDSNGSNESEEGIPGAYYGGYGSCYICGSRGHWANGCPNA